MRHRLHSLPACLLALTAVAVAQPSYERALADLTAALRSSLPQVQQATQQAHATRAQARSSLSLDPPMLSVEYMDGMEIDYSVEQMLPFPGKVSAMAAARQQQAVAADLGARSVERKAVADLRAAFAELWLARRSVALLSENVALVRSLAELAQSRYAASRGSLAEMLAAKAELAGLVGDSLVAVESVRRAVARVNAAAGRTTDAAVAACADPLLPQPASGDEALCSLAVRNRPELAAMQAELAMAEAEARASRRDYLPDLTLKATWRSILDAPDAWSAMAGVSVPVAPWSLRRVRGTAQAGRFGVEAARQGVAAMRAMLLSEVLDHAAHMRAAAAVVTSADSSAIPLGRQALEAALSQYRAGTGELRMLLDSRRMLVDAQQKRDMMVTDLLQAQASLDLATAER